MTSPIQQTFTREASDSRALVVDGHNVVVRVKDMHLTIQDGMAGFRRTSQFARSERKLKRLIILCHTGMISFDALRWMDDVGIEWMMLHPRERNQPRWGQLIGTSGRSGADTELRHIQAQMHSDRLGVDIWRYLLKEKFAGHHNPDDSWTRQLDRCHNLERLREVESVEAEAYFDTWRGMEVRFNGRKVPDSWCTWNGRRSGIVPIRNRRASNPVNALLNYSYAILEAEAVLACYRVGLDPDLGINHVDRKRSHAFAFDLMEAGRGHVDRWIRNMVATRTFDRKEFAQDPEGQVRVLRPLTHICAEQCMKYAQILEPVAKEVVHMIESTYRLGTGTNRLERIGR